MSEHDIPKKTPSHHWRTFCVSLAFICLVIVHDAHCAESYSIGGRRVLLYKIINWWYDCLEEESGLLCGRTARCRSRGDTRVVYKEAEKKLRLQMKGGFAGQFSIFKPCKTCSGPSYLRCTWLNEKYFGKGEAELISEDSLLIGVLMINNIEKSHVQIIQRIEKDIEFELEGSIGGLLNGRIALHQAGNFIKPCPRDYSAGTPPSLRIVNANTQELLAIYTAIMEN